MIELLNSRVGVKGPEAFREPVYITRPKLPEIEDVTEKLREVWASCQLTNNGMQQRRLEDMLQFKLDVPYVSLFNNGTVALMAACKSLGLSGEVITTPFTFAATPHALTWNNIVPVFCDIDADTMNIDASRIESLITEKTSGILAVHTFGTPCDIEGIEKVAGKYGLKVVYDAAHAFGIEVDGVGVGNFGDISMVSFHATKIFHTAEGGALLYKGAGLKERIDCMRNFGIKSEDEVVMAGLNGKMNEIQAAIGIVNLKSVDEEIERRKKLTCLYRYLLDDVDGISFYCLPENVKGNYHYFVIRIDEDVFGVSRDAVCEKLKEYNVFARKYFYPLCSDYQCYLHLRSADPKGLEVARKVASEVLCLPLYGDLKEGDVERICAMLKGFAAEKPAKVLAESIY